MDIYTYLQKDHRKVARLFKNIISSRTSKEKKRLFLELKQELELHADPEHHTFYEALRTNNLIGEEDAAHADKEHNEIKKSLAKLNKVSNNTVHWWVQLGELKRIVEHHVEDEENKMFEDAKNIISESEAEELVEKMEKLKETMMQSKLFKNKYASNQKPSKNRKK
jgi:hypothetical protein